MKFGTDVDKHIVIPFLRSSKPMVIINGIPVGSIWSVQAIGYQKEIKKTLGMTSKTHAYLKFEMTAYARCQIDL